jgi:putative ABC transport system ATP-binding protein
MDIFNKIHAEGNSVVLVTHEDDISRFAHRIIRLKDGLLESDRINETVSVIGA